MNDFSCIVGIARATATPCYNIPQCTIQNRNVHISVLNDALWDIEQVHCEICEFCQSVLLSFVLAELSRDPSKSHDSQYEEGFK